MPTKRKRGRKHPGVVLVKPDPKRRIGWRVRFVHPDTKNTVRETLDPALTTLEQREACAIRKSKELARRRIEIETGAPRETGTKLGKALERYFTAHKTTLRPRTLKIYRTASDKLERWAVKADVDSADALTRAKLMAFRETLIRAPKRVAKKGAKRGSYAKGDRTRSAAAVNQDLRAAGTVLRYVRDLDLFPHVTHDDLRRALKLLPGAPEQAEFLKPHECRQLLEATLRHDAATFDATREEHAGLRAVGTTPRYPAIAPLVLVALLTGMRLGEIVSLEWAQVELEALDHEGRKVGEIKLKGSATKTNKPRTVGLEVSSALQALLAKMHLASGGKGPVFGLTRNAVEAAGDRLKKTYGAPASFTWQVLRSTCACFLTNSPGIFGAASAYRSARQLGHSVAVAETHYLDVMRGIPRDARTVEAAMQIEDIAAQIAGVGAPKKGRARKQTKLRAVAP